MRVKVLSSLTSIPRRRNHALVIGTHDGIFHCDEVVACALLLLFNLDKSAYILRTRNTKNLGRCDILVDIGGGVFDHHQVGFLRSRVDGTKYASAGLIWEKYGEVITKFVFNKYFPNITFSPHVLNLILKSFDENAIAPVDREDNGVKAEHCFSFIPAFCPLWFGNGPEDFNNQFKKALLVTMEVLEQELKKTIGREIASTIIKNNWLNTDCCYNGILEIPSQSMDWKEIVIKINGYTHSFINFVIFPYPSGGWAAQCVPTSIEDEFTQRIPFPVKWAGQTDALPEISGVEGATFCHNGCFFVRAISKEDVIRLCEIATNAVQ